jgi:hypothetical protein
MNVNNFLFFKGGENDDDPGDRYSEWTWTTRSARRGKHYHYYCLFKYKDFILLTLEFSFVFIQVMSLHPQYMKIFSKSQAFIMRGDGPLPFHYRHYIAIMVLI